MSPLSRSKSAGQGRPLWPLETRPPSAHASYPDRLAQLLQLRKPSGPKVVDLFAGCGGLSLGFSAQGFEVLGYEKEYDPASTYRQNLNQDCREVTLVPGVDIAAAQVVIGGPPSQPFSVIGRQQGKRDVRDGFPAFVDAVRRLDPDIWLFENVPGMKSRNRPYLLSIFRELASLGYIVEGRILNARQYGVPQNRLRLFVVGHRGKFIWPAGHKSGPNVGDALADLLNHPIDSSTKILTTAHDAYIARYEAASRTAPRDLSLDRPARTLTCRNLGGATGDMLRIKIPDGRRRRLTVREAARLQSFPDWFEFRGKLASQFEQIGNAVPPLVAYSLAGSVLQYLASPFREEAESLRRRNARTVLT